MTEFGAAESKQHKTEELAEEVLELSRSRLLVNLRYMDTALTFHERVVYDGSMSVNGSCLFYDPVFVLKTYRDSGETLAHMYLHSVLHCVFMHPFMCSSMDRRLWDLACDLAVEAVMCELDLPCTRTGRDAKRKDVLKKIRRETGFLTAERIYAVLKNGIPAETDEEAVMKSLEELFRADDHSIWYAADVAEADTTGSAEADIVTAMPDADAAEQWKHIAEQIEMEIETFAKVKGKYASSLVQNLRSVNRERYDYSEFLRKFAVTNETVKASYDEFDYIYYDYGLKHYRNMPLIEPLEYREDKRIKDFVIAIDTSGSVAGEKVQSFLQKTCDILKNRESFHSKVNVHIIQCDAKVQSDTVITCPEDFDRYFETMEIRGLGGTDFRPVFGYVDRLLGDGDFSDLKGLIYFTDGLGTYPAAKPSYKTVFVFVESGYNVPEVPVWAMKVVLQPEEL